MSEHAERGRQMVDGIMRQMVEKHLAAEEEASRARLAAGDPYTCQSVLTAAEVVGVCRALELVLLRRAGFELRIRAQVCEPVCIRIPTTYSLRSNEHVVIRHSMSLYEHTLPDDPKDLRWSAMQLPRDAPGWYVLASHRGLIPSEAPEDLSHVPDWHTFAVEAWPAEAL